MNPSAGFVAILWMVLDALIVGATVLAFRAAYRWVQDRSIFGRQFSMEGDEGDAMTHLVAIDLVRQNGHRIPRETPQFLLSTEFDYPALFHKLMSYIPRRWLERGEWLISPGFEGAHAALVYIAAWFAFVQIGLEHIATPMALLSAAGWAITPLLTHNPRRGSVIGERCFGYMFGHAFLFSLTMVTVTGELFWLIPAIVAFTIAAASSKFAFQAMTFIGLVLAAIRLDPVPLAALAVCFIASLVLSRGYIARVCTGTFRHSRFYRSFIVHIHDYTRAFSTRDLRQGVSLLLRGRGREAVAAFRRHPVHRLPSLVPWLFPFMLYLLLAPSPRAPLASALIDWSLAALVVTALTATDSLKFLGEAERYMEFALLPIIVLSMLVPPPFGPTVLFVIFAFGLFRMGVRYVTPGRVSSATPDTIELARWLATRPPTTILTVPGRLCFPLLYRTEHRAVWWFTNAPYGERLETLKSLFEGGAIYPYLAPAVLRRPKFYGADLIVVDKAGAAAAIQYWGLRYDWTGYRVLFENGKYVVVDCAQPATGYQDAAAPAAVSALASRARSAEA